MINRWVGGVAGKLETILSTLCTSCKTVLITPVNVLELNNGAAKRSSNVCC
jgi:hypothetical protein